VTRLNREVEEGLISPGEAMGRRKSSGFSLKANGLSHIEFDKRYVCD